MRRGLIGEHLGHSYSKRIHEALGGYAYDLIGSPATGSGRDDEGAGFRGAQRHDPL